MEAFKSAISETNKKLTRTTQHDFPSSLPMDLTQYFDEASERTWTEPFTFILTADTQFGLIEKHILKKANARWDEEMALTRSTIRCINRMRPKPKFIVVCGDMLDEQPGPNEEKIATREEQYQDFIQVFQELDPDIPLVCVCGNHDICDVPTEESYEIYKKQFGPDFYSFWVGGVKFVVINSQYFKQPEALPRMTRKQEEFISKMADPRAKHLVVLQHIPFFVKDPDEDDISFVNIEEGMRFKMMDTYNDLGVDYVFCGHYHRNAGGRYKNFEQVVTTALGGTFGADPSGYRICHVTPEGIFHNYIPVMMDKTARVARPLPNANVSKQVLRTSFASRLRKADPDKPNGVQSEFCLDEDDRNIKPSLVLSSLSSHDQKPNSSLFSFRDFLSMKFFH